LVFGLEDYDDGELKKELEGCLRRGYEFNISINPVSINSEYGLTSLSQ